MGLTHVYTGDGKGKTTASYGLLLRALGSGMSVYLGQFFKNTDQSELRLLNELKKHLDKNQLLTITQYETFSKDTVISCIKGFDEIKKALFSGLYDMVIADEINVAINLGILDEEEILEVIEENKEVEFILTGRCAKESIVNKANLVSDIKKVKHYHDEGLIPRIGIEK